VRLSKTGQARLWAIGLGALTLLTAMLIVVVNPFEVAAVYLVLLGLVILAGLMTNLWGGLAASALSVFAMVLFNRYAGIYLRESRILNIGTELGALMLVGPLAGGLAGALNQLQRDAEHWMARADELTVREATFDTLKPEWARARLEEEALRAARFHRPLSVALLQLDPGPEAPGSNRAERVGALQAVIRVARVTAPPPAVVAHAGGDRVLLILPEQTAEQTQHILAAVQECLAHEVYFLASAATLNKSLGKPVNSWGAVRAGVASLNGQTEGGEALLARAKAQLEG